MELIGLLIGAGADVTRKDNRDNVALHHAAMRGDVNVIKALVEAGSDVDAQNRQGWTPLMNACYWCKPDAAAVFIEMGQLYLIQTPYYPWLKSSGCSVTG